MSSQSVKCEAAVLLKLNAGVFTPHCFGVCESLNAIVMSFINIENNAMSLYTLLHEQPPMMTKQLCSQLVVQVCDGLRYVHGKGFLQNDLKLDNVVIGESLTQSVRAYIIDFGKACLLANGKRYHLTEEEKSLYKREHSQVAPDLRDGVVCQCVATDVYSFGRILKRVNATVLHSATLSTLAKQILLS